MTASPLPPVRCHDCTHVNDARRQYCGGCGGDLRAVCGACAFANTVEDRFCGGCGVEMRPVSATPGRAPPSARGAAELDELTALLASPPVELETQLPEAGIVQADVDRLFGVVA